MHIKTSVIKEREHSQANLVHYENVFDSKTCIKIIDFSQENLEMEKALVGKGNTSSRRKSDIAWIKPSSETNFIFSKIIEKMNYVNKFYNFDLVGITEPIQFTSYDGSGNEHYGWHLDMDGGFKSRRKLSIVIQLSDENEYEGGELQIDTCTVDGQFTVGNQKRGSMIFFPSYMRHRVTPVTSGHRFSLVSWISGQPYK